METTRVNENPYNFRATNLGINPNVAFIPARVSSQGYRIASFSCAGNFSQILQFSVSCCEYVGFYIKAL